VEAENPMGHVFLIKHVYLLIIAITKVTYYTSLHKEVEPVVYLKG